MVPEAELEKTDAGLVRKTEGWFVLNARDAAWRLHPRFGGTLSFDGEVKFLDVGIHLKVLEPGQPACLYHGENAQEDFLVLSGECLLLVEGQERRLRAMDFVHTPPGAEHVFVGAGEGPCTLIMIGHRVAEPEFQYPAAEVAQKHAAAAKVSTPNPREAYAGEPTSDMGPAPEGLLR